MLIWDIIFVNRMSYQKSLGEFSLKNILTFKLLLWKPASSIAPKGWLSVTYRKRLQDCIDAVTSGVKRVIWQKKIKSMKLQWSSNPSWFGRLSPDVWMFKSSLTGRNAGSCFWDSVKMRSTAAKTFMLGQEHFPPDHSLALYCVHALVSCECPKVAILSLLGSQKGHHWLAMCVSFPVPSP